MGRILDSAQRLFAERGFADVTTKEISAAAGVGEATLFRHVTSKEELLLLVMGEQSERVLASLEQADEATVRSGSASDRQSGMWYLDRVLAIYRTRVDFYTAYPENVSSYISCGLRADLPVGERSISHGDRVIARVARILGAAQDAQVLRSDVDAGVVALNCNGLWIHEVLRLPVRGFTVASTWERLESRLWAQLYPLLMPAEAAKARRG